MAVYHLKASFGSRAGGQSARAKADYIERESRYEKDGEELEHKEHGNMPEWAQEDPGKYWEAADENERAKDCSICSRHRKVLVDISSFVTSAVGIDACDSRNCRASDTRWYSPSCSLLANPPPVHRSCPDVVWRVDAGVLSASLQGPSSCQGRTLCSVPQVNASSLVPSQSERR